MIPAFTLPMLSYHNDPLVKAKYIARFAAHRLADEVIQGQGFKNGRGCFVGCTLDAYNHYRFPTELGWPIWLAYLADAIFEDVPKNEAAQFGTDLLNAVPVGVNLEQVKNRFLLSVQLRSLKRIKHTTTPNEDACIASIQTVIDLLEKDVAKESDVWANASYAARSAAQSAESASESAESAAGAAKGVPAWSSQFAANSAGYAEYEESKKFSLSAQTKEYQMQRDDLLALLKDCK